MLAVLVLPLFCFATLDYEALASAKTRYFSLPSLLRKQAKLNLISTFSLSKLKTKSTAALSSPTCSVTVKTMLPASGNIHDYYSLARYFHPNPNTPDKLPYVRRDGVVNPEIKEVPDYAQFAKMEKETMFLTLMYLLDKENGQVYGQRAVQNLYLWFLDPQTYMTPHLKYASVIRGYPNGRAQGIIDLHDMFIVLDCITILKYSSYWQPDYTARLNEWFTKYLEFLQLDPIGKEEFNSKNNHGTYFDIQALSLLLYLERKDEARTFAANIIPRRIQVQISEDGSQPLEAVRQTSFFYHKFNLHGFMVLARLSKNVDVDLYKDGKIILALEYLVPFILKEKEWPFVQIQEEVDEMGYSEESMVEAFIVTGNQKWMEILKKMTGGRYFDYSDGFIGEVLLDEFVGLKAESDASGLTDMFSLSILLFVFLY